MLSATFAMLMACPYLMLRLTGVSGSFPRPLSAEEESEYIRRYAEGDMEARNILIERNLRLVAHIIKKYYTQTGDQDDLISIGTIGLIKGFSTYRPDKNVRLATYASRCIEKAILSPRKKNPSAVCTAESGGNRTKRPVSALPGNRRDPDERAADFRGGCAC